ncbi:restriction endonuclease subunit S [bacterium]|nr:restriction endonuclease subunit S [bacterium]
MINQWSLPSGWNWARLEDVAVRANYAIVDGPFGSALKTSHYVKSGVPVLQGKNITGDKFQPFGFRYVTEKKAQELSRSLVTPGDILMVKIGSIGYAAILDSIPGSDCALIPANLAKVTPNPDKVSSEYLLRWLTCLDMKRHLLAVASKTAQPALNLTKIKEVPVPLPPLSEQKRIAAILDKADAIRRKRQESKALTEELIHSTFQDMFSNKNYPKLSVGSFCSVKGGKRLPKGAAYADNKTNHPYIRVTDFSRGSVRMDGLKYLHLDTQSLISRYTISSKDVYISIAGTIGIAGVIPPNLTGANLTENAAKLVINTDNILNKYLAYFLNSDLGQIQIRSKTKATSQPKLALFRIEEIEVPIPPIEKQNEFNNIVENISNSSKSLQKSKASSDNLFTSLQQRAFSGELSTN